MFLECTEIYNICTAVVFIYRPGAVFARIKTLMSCYRAFLVMLTNNGRKWERSSKRSIKKNI